MDSKDILIEIADGLVRDCNLRIEHLERMVQERDETIERLKVPAAEIRELAVEVKGLKEDILKWKEAWDER